MALFDGTGSFGLGFGGFDVSDFLGLTGEGGLGTMNSVDVNLGDSFNESIGNVKAGDSTWLVDKMETPENNTGMSLFGKTDTGLGNITGLGDSTGGYKSFGDISKQNLSSNNPATSGSNGSDWVTNAVSLANLANSLYKDKDARDYRDDTFNNQVKTQNDSLEGKKQLVRSYYSIDDGDSAETAAAKSNNNPTLTRESYSTR